MSTAWAFENIENKHTLYRGKDCIKNFCESLRECTKDIIDFQKKENGTVNQRRTKIISRCKSMFCGKRSLKRFTIDEK